MKLHQRYKLTLITIPSSLVFLFLTFFSVGADRGGTSIVIFFYYSSVYLVAYCLPDKMVELSGIVAILFSIVLLTGLHIFYAFVGDKIINNKVNINWFWLLLVQHYLSFLVLLNNTEVQKKEFSEGKFVRYWESNKEMLVFCLAAFIVWQAFVLYYIHARINSSKNNSNSGK